MAGQHIQEIRDLYRKRAKRYDLSANLYYLMGFREFAYRKHAVRALQINRGDTVVEIGCGTGLNFSLIQNRIGPEGKIIGVDLTGEMLLEAQQRCEKNNWKNVELVEQDAGLFNFPEQVDGVISTFALTLVPDYKKVIHSAYNALKKNKTMVVLDLKAPNWPKPLVNLAIWLTSPFGVSWEMASHHPWEEMQKVFSEVSMHYYYMGSVYLASGRKL